MTHFTNALTILQAKLAVIEQDKLGADGGAGTEEDQEEEDELRRSASRALVGMTELYLTDLWCVKITRRSFIRAAALTRTRDRSMEEDAEQNCEKHLALASQIDPSDPEVYQVCAFSYRHYSAHV